jgi:hypothetical protein
MVIRHHRGDFVSGESHFPPICWMLNVPSSWRVFEISCVQANSSGMAAKLNKVKQDQSLHGPLFDKMKFLLHRAGELAMLLLEQCDTP